MKIIVYAISKNEEKFVDRWVASMKEADGIYVLDTGSTDHTVDKLKQLGVNVKVETIKPWRFDVARNKSLALIPEDVDFCVCTDLDEVFLPGWRKELEKHIQEGITRISYTYHWRLDENDKPLISFYISKIHSRKGYQWTHPVHEVLHYLGNGEEFTQCIDTITVHHYPNNQKSRSSYLPLLELSVQEDPEDDRNMHYLGREYMYYGYDKKAIQTLKKHLSLKRATWKDERCASMRFIARCYGRLQKWKLAYSWADKAIKEAPYLRDPFMEKAMLAYEQKDWNTIIDCSLKALQIPEGKKSYISEEFCRNVAIYDLLSIAFYQIGLYDFSYTAIQKALSFSPKDSRLQSNAKLIDKKRK